MVALSPSSLLVAAGLVALLRAPVASSALVCEDGDLMNQVPVTITASSHGGTDYPFKINDGIATGYGWLSGYNAVDHWLLIDFGSSFAYPQRFRVKSNAYSISKLTLQGSLDGVTFVDIDSVSGISTSSWFDRTIPSPAQPNLYRFIRLYLPNLSAPSSSRSDVSEMEILGCLDTVPPTPSPSPDCRSNLAVDLMDVFPVSITADSVSSSDTPSKVNDGIWSNYGWLSGWVEGDRWLKLSFQDDRQVSPVGYRIISNVVSYAPTSIIVQGSYDNQNFVDIDSVNGVVCGDVWYERIIPNPPSTFYPHIRFYLPTIHGGSRGYMDVAELEVFGCSVWLPSPSPTPTSSMAPSASSSPTSEPSTTTSPSPTSSPSSEPTPSLTASLSPSASPSRPPSPSASATTSPSPSASATTTSSPSATAEPTPSSSQTAAASPSVTPTPSALCFDDQEFDWCAFMSEAGFCASPQTSSLATALRERCAVTCGYACSIEGQCAVNDDFTIAALARSLGITTVRSCEDAHNLVGCSSRYISYMRRYCPCFCQ